MNTDALTSILSAIEKDRELWSDFIALCDCGGRRAGTASEEKALQFLRERLRGIDGEVLESCVPYAGWHCRSASLELADGTALVCNPLLGSESTSEDGLTAELCDLGRGSPEDFEQRAGDIRGRIVLVKHEYPFSAEHIHRRRKLQWAMERGAVGFIIGNPHSGAGPVTGSSGRGRGRGIPAVGTDYESAVRLGGTREPVRLVSIGEDYSAETSVLTLQVWPEARNCVVLSAHVDGHDLAESALDNASGVAVALALARAFAPRAKQCARGLRVCFFSAEEWALAGSRQYLDTMSAGERDAIALNINLDTVAGDDRLTALTSEFPRLEKWVGGVATEYALAVDTYAPMMANSDHYNFARHGIPALRLVAGFNRPESNIRYILTRADTREKARRSELLSAARIAAALLWAGLTAATNEIRALRG